MILIEPLGDCGLLIEFGQEASIETQEKVTSFSNLLTELSIEGFIEHIPAYTTVSIFYDPVYFTTKTGKLPYENCKKLVEQLLQRNRNISGLKKRNIVTIPVCYGDQYGPDLDIVANIHSLSREDVISIHTESIYTVSMIGFAPGFPYLSGLNNKIATPRLATPRKQVPKGSVGIAGVQTGIYSIASPGGWQIIGRTPITLFEHEKPRPSLLQQGDRVRFEPITEAQFISLGEGLK